MVKQKTGRELFKKIKPVLKVINKLYSLIPASFFKSTWFLIDAMPGKIGMLLRYLHFYRLAEKCGDNVMIGPRCTILNHDKMIVGDNVTIHTMSYLDAVGGIKIGNNVSIAHNCSLISFDHSFDNVNIPIKYNPLILDEIIIEDDVWLGCAVRVLSGVTIKQRTVAAAGAVIIKGEYTSGILAGVPAKIRREF